MPTRNDEKTLIQRAQKGDEEALVELYRRHAPAIFRYFFFRLRDEATAEDLTGDVFLRMLEALQRYTEQGVPFAAWLFRIAHDRAVDHHRAMARRPTESLSDSLADHRPNPETEAAQRVEAQRMLGALAGLTDEQRTVIQLRFTEGYNLEETARVMRKTVGAVKALQHRALQSLARKLDT